MFDPEKLTEMLENFQKQAKKLEEASKNKIYTTKSGGGLLNISINGAGEVVDLNIDASLLNDRESLQILLISAINEAYQNVSADKRTEAMGMLGDLGNLFGHS